MTTLMLAVLLAAAPAETNAQLAEQVRQTETAFAKTMADPVFREEAAKRDVEVDPTLGEDLQTLVEKMLQTDARTVELLAATLAKP